MIVDVRRIANYVALLLLLTAVVPVFACVTGTSFTPEERACCQTMQGQCGEMAMMECCRTQVRTAHLPELATAPHVSTMHWVVLAHLGLTAPTLKVAFTRLARLPEQYPPPGLVTARSTVLRV